MSCTGSSSTSTRPTEPGAARSAARGLPTAVTLAWWCKEGDAFRAAYAERQKSKVGRMARLRGEVVRVEPLGVLA